LWTAEPDEVTLLRDQVQALQLRLSPPTVQELQGAVSLDKVQRFRSLRDLPGWSSSLLAVLETALASPEHDPQQTLQSVWDILVESWAKADSAPSTGGRQLPAKPAGGGAGKSRPLPFGLALFKDKGGTLTVEELNGHGTTLGIFEGRKYYFSKKGQFWDISRPPPTPCHSCGDFHWAWECPHSSASF
jgi:hypothetical protein